MTIELISFIHGLKKAKKLSLCKEIINNSTSDLALFCGGTISTAKDIIKLENALSNKKTEVILELESIKSDYISACLYRISKGSLINMYTNQLFATSQEIKDNYHLADRLLNEFESRRTFKCKRRKILLMQCGELNILKNIQSNDNKVAFRLNDEPDLKKRFKQLLENTDIILNPMHTPMGNQGKMKMRRKFLSKKGRYYFSVSNSKPESSNLWLKSMQYAFYNSKEMQAFDTEIEDDYIIRRFEV